MTRTLLASAGLLATATLVNAMGSAVVVNQCSYPVSLTNVPASGGGQNQIGPESLSTGGSYSQVYTPLSNDQGWSIKLSIGNSEPLQYEYTTHSDGTIWFDLSAVNGDPFNGNWYISSGGGCTPKQAAYQYPTDDAAAMQSCADSSTITVTLCANGGSAPAPPSAPSAPAHSSPMAPPQVPAPSVPAASVPNVPVSAPPVAAPSVPAAAPSADSAPPAAPSADSVPSAAPSADSRPNWGPPADKVGGFRQLQATPDVVTNVHTKVVTQWVTVSPSPIGKRSEHLHRHAERHNHF